MKTIQINISNIAATFNSLKNECQGQLQETSTERILKFQNELGSGNISGFNFNDNISYITYDVQFNENTTLIFDQDTNKQSLNYIYCSQGELLHSFGATKKRARFSEMQTAIFSNSLGKANHIHIQKDGYLKFTMISFLASKPITEETDEFTSQLMQLFHSKEIDGKFSYTSSYNLKIKEQLDQIDGVSSDNIASALLKKGMLQVSLSMIVKQYFEDMERIVENSCGLTRKELEVIKDVGEFIKNYPDRQFDINYLKKKTGLTPAKLQTGFKMLFGRTVLSFIKNVRVELAEKLIKNSDLSISEIVYTIGFSSRSYFSKIFKEKYNCSPKEYQDGKVTLAMTA
ncbi:AraC family transcriptional regulator [Kordia algicida OT-1]|uniref:Two-component system sensor histidine kinase/response regulator, hybrid ('one component system') n=1 Tax=Kordia algicida OT-1 TaxID=391587 RepID=A9E8B0_9FLAO|nr:AraC family transcriptional regulator [Kordia algicida]EDP94763.1 two-component system sensor histidine kinase/response regulator, hybrid ('one component system') [Kordia algicida OT-1]